MNAKDFSVDALVAMAHSPVRNYVVPGLTSWLIGAPSEAGTMRLFVSEREHQESITPHSHRFDFQCWVLTGTVRNRLWRSTYPQDPSGDRYQATTLRYDGEIGKYAREPGEINCWRYEDREFSQGECYSMKASEVHSIFFSRGARVLFFEGPKVSDTSVVIEPVSGGEVIPTLEVKPWMFKRS